jgi:hypothetical protein
MSKNVAHPAKALPIRPRAKRLGLVTKSDGSLGDDLQFAFNSRPCLPVFLIPTEVDPCNKCVDMVMLCRMSLRWVCASLKG